MSASSSPSARAPDLCAPVVGWRAWAVAVRAGAAVLRSPVYDDTWPQRAPFRAVCRGDGAHDAPAPACTCGVHAARTGDAAASHLVGRDDVDVVHRVLGQVAVWGTVVESRGGWRGALAYPVRLLVPTRHADGTRFDVDRLAPLLSGYGVPVELFSREDG